MTAPATLPYAFPDVPGLTLEPMTAEDLDHAAQLAVDEQKALPCDGDHSLWPADLLGPLPPCEGPLSHIRNRLTAELEATDRWSLVLAFQGRPLQYEIVELDPARPGVAEVRLTLRASRERPAWFWREAEQPVFAALAAAGIQQHEVWVPPGSGTFHAKRLRDFLEEHFGAAYNGQWRKGAARCWAMPVDLARFTGWPARRTAPPWQRGSLAIVACGLDQALALMPALWAGYSETRAADATRVLRERALLDGGTIALGSESGAPKALWVTRDHGAGGPEAWMTTCTPWAAAPRLLHKGIFEWQLALGYTTAVSAWEAWMWNLPRARSLVPYRELSRRTHHGAEWVTTAVTLADAVAIPDARWV